MTLFLKHENTILTKYEWSWDWLGGFIIAFVNVFMKWRTISVLYPIIFIFYSRNGVHLGIWLYLDKRACNRWILLIPNRCLMIRAIEWYNSRVLTPPSYFFISSQSIPYIVFLIKINLCWSGTCCALQI